MPLTSLTGLNWLSLDNTAVIDLTPLAGLTGLQRLTLCGTTVADLRPLADLTGLQLLYLDANVDAAPVKHIKGLRIYRLAPVR